MFPFARHLLLGGIVLSVFQIPASAGVIYDNGPNNGTVDARTISGGFAVTDSFTLASAAAVSGVSFGAATTTGSTPLSVQWSLGTAAFGSDLGSGTAATLSNSGLTVANYFGGLFDLHNSSFSFGDIDLGAGTYYLTLQSGSSSSGSLGIGWDVSNGSSMAFQTTNGAIQSESFQILDSATGGAAPEPGSISMALAGIVFIGWKLRGRYAGTASEPAISPPPIN